MRICRGFENWRDLRALSGKFLRQKSCYPESFRFLWLWEEYLKVGGNIQRMTNFQTNKLMNWTFETNKKNISSILFEAEIHKYFKQFIDDGYDIHLSNRNIA